MYNLLNNYNSTNYYAQYMVHVFFAANDIVKRAQSERIGNIGSVTRSDLNELL
jgi:hypothetical protein